MNPLPASGRSGTAGRILAFLTTAALVTALLFHAMISFRVGPP